MHELSCMLAHRHTSAVVIEVLRCRVAKTEPPPKCLPKLDDDDCRAIERMRAIIVRAPRRFYFGKRNIKTQSWTLSIQWPSRCQLSSIATRHINYPNTYRYFSLALCALPQANSLQSAHI